jgi:hypothetical protein
MPCWCRDCDAAAVAAGAAAAAWQSTSTDCRVVSSMNSHMVYIPVQSGCALSVAADEVALTTTAGTRPLLLRTRALPWACAQPCCFSCMLVIVRGALHWRTHRDPEVRFVQHTSDTLCKARPQLLYEDANSFKSYECTICRLGLRSQLRDIGEKACHLSSELY